MHRWLQLCFTRACSVLSRGHCSSDNIDLTSEGNITGVNRLPVCISTDLLYTVRVHSSFQSQMHSKVALVNEVGVSRATQVRVWAVWWCFRRRHFHSQVDKSNLSNSWSNIYKTPGAINNNLGTSSDRATKWQRSAITSQKKVDFTVCTKCCYWYCSIQKLNDRWAHRKLSFQFSKAAYATSLPVQHPLCCFCSVCGKQS